VDGGREEEERDRGAGSVDDKRPAGKGVAEVHPLDKWALLAVVGGSEGGREGGKEGGGEGGKRE